MLYELRVYHAMPGKLSTLDARFADHAVRLFEKHGIEAVGYWTTYIGPANRLTYILAWDDLGERERCWDAFASDPEWLEVTTESEKDGPLIERSEVFILKSTEYSPLR